MPAKCFTVVEISIREQMDGGDDFGFNPVPEGDSEGPVRVRVDKTFFEPTYSQIQTLMDDALRGAGFFPHGR